MNRQAFYIHCMPIKEVHAMEVSTIRIRHYAPEGAQCAPVKETYETLSNMME